MTDAEHDQRAVVLYAMIDRFPEDFMEELPSASDDTLYLLWQLFTTPNPKADTSLNNIGADMVSRQFEIRGLARPERGKGTP